MERQELRAGCGGATHRFCHPASMNHLPHGTLTTSGCHQPSCSRHDHRPTRTPAHLGQHNLGVVPLERGGGLGPLRLQLLAVAAPGRVELRWERAPSRQHLVLLAPQLCGPGMQGVRDGRGRGGRPVWWLVQQGGGCPCPAQHCSNPWQLQKHVPSEGMRRPSTLSPACTAPGSRAAIDNKNNIVFTSATTNGCFFTSSSSWDSPEMVTTCASQAAAAVAAPAITHGGGGGAALAPPPLLAPPDLAIPLACRPSAHCTTSRQADGDAHAAGTRAQAARVRPPALTSSAAAAGPQVQASASNSAIARRAMLHGRGEGAVRWSCAPRGRCLPDTAGTFQVWTKTIRAARHWDRAVGVNELAGRLAMHAQRRGSGAAAPEFADPRHGCH